MFSLEGKVAVVTGASRGLGRAIALAYAGQGADIVGAARNGAELDSLRQEIEAKGRRAVVSQTDITDLEQILDAQSQRIAQLRRRVAALANAVADPSLPDAQRVILRIQLAEARRSLAQALHARTGTVASGVTASVSLDLTTGPGKAAVVHHRGRLGRMLHSAVGFLALEGTIVLYALVLLSPLVLLAALLWWARTARRRRDERRLLAA